MALPERPAFVYGGLGRQEKGMDSGTNSQSENNPPCALGGEPVVRLEGRRGGHWALLRGGQPRSTNYVRMSDKST